MIFRFALPLIFLLLITIPASGVDSPQLLDVTFAVAVAKMKDKDYRGAMEAALQAPAGNTKDFLIGMAAIRLGEWEKAAEFLGKPGAGFPFLTDYTVYNHALALDRLGRHQESLATLQGFANNYPESPLIRSADKLMADILYDSGNFPAAAAAYQAFTEKYSSGTDTLEALHNLALCREKTGDAAGAVSTLRNIWLMHPASSFAAVAEKDLSRLAEHGAKAAPYTGEELLQRGTILSNLRKYDKALKTFKNIAVEGEPEEFIQRLLLKTGQVQFKARHFLDAEQTFSELLARNPRLMIGDELRYWQAKTLDRVGREEEAFTIYTKLADTSPASSLAVNALLAAAFIRKYQNRSDDELALLKMLVQNYPKSRQAQIALWEIAWTRYQAGDLTTAAVYFKKQLNNDETRDRALYWYGRTLAATGDEKGAADAFAALVNEYPLGFYAMSYEQEANIKDDGTISIPPDICAILPLPPGFERAKSLISLGLYDDAKKEISASRRKFAGKPGIIHGLARLYLEMGDYHAAYSLFRDRHLYYPVRNSLAEWGIAYPLAFRDDVAANAAKSGVPECLVYAVIRAESSYFPSAHSPAGAIGLMQVMPATAVAVAKGKEKECIIDRLILPDINIRLGVKHLKDLLILYNGDPAMAVAAYNAGSGNVNRWRKNLGKMPRNRFIENIPFPETREYVKKVLAGAEIYRKLYKLGEISCPSRAAASSLQNDATQVQPSVTPKAPPRSNADVSKPSSILP